MKKILIPLIIVLLGALVYFAFNNFQSGVAEKLMQQEQVGRGNGYGPGDGTGTMMGYNNTPNPTRGNCNGEVCLAVDSLEYPVGDLSEEATQSLEKALDDEYKAYSTYDAVIKKFGNIRPFIMIIRGEEQHISSLKGLFDKYGLEIPENPYLGNITAPETIALSCSTGVEAEIENAALYRDNLLPNVSEYEDITLVFNNLMNASQNQHLSAFERCAE